MTIKHAIKGQIIAVTGQCVGASRSEIMDMIKRHGGNVTGKIDNQVTTLLVGDSGQSASKIAAARKRGLTIMSYADMFGAPDI